MKNRKKTEMTAQELYIKEQQHHKRTVSFSRFFIFIAFLLLWETASDLGWIDSFFFSSPSRIKASRSIKYGFPAKEEKDW